MTAPPLARNDLGEFDTDTDGRRALRERNRLSVVDAMLALYADGNLDPSSDEIAERAGLSPRSLFRYFDDLDDLVQVAIARHHARVAILAEVTTTPDQPLAERVERLVDQRLRLFEAIGSVGLVSRLRAPFQPLIATELRNARAFWRRQIEAVFACELEALGTARAYRVLSCIDVLTSFESVQLMRDDQRLSRAQTAATLTESLRLLLRGGV
ncbi:MAG: TetR/AcrR family transcriptional regulator [Actinobacteria bacterium]|nr:TetR/AcrR family transcriptional regulator [Actinomycetota bacterium]